MSEKDSQAESQKNSKGKNKRNAPKYNYRHALGIVFQRLHDTSWVQNGATLLLAFVPPLLGIIMGGIKGTIYGLAATLTLIIWALAYLWIKELASQPLPSSSSAASAPEQESLPAKRPNFSVRENAYTVKSSGFCFTVKELDGDMALVTITSPNSFEPGGPVRKGTVLEASVKNGLLYVNADLYTWPNGAPMKLRNNELIDKPVNWDCNFKEDRAMEVVNESGNPIFQLIYNDDKTATIYGIFTNGVGVLLSDNRTLRMANDIENTQIFMQPIFKYPSYQYKGTFLDGTK